MHEKREELLGAVGQGGATSPESASATPAPAPATVTPPGGIATSSRPVLPGGVEQFFVPIPASANVVYHAAALGAADITLSSAKYGVNTTRRVVHRTAICDGALPVDWEQAEELKLDPNDLETEPLPGASFAACIRSMARAIEHSRSVSPKP